MKVMLCSISVCLRYANKPYPTTDAARAWCSFISISEPYTSSVGIGHSCSHETPILQNLAEDWSTGSTGCYDAVSLARLQGILKYDFKAVATGNCDLCLNLPIANEYRDQLILETLRADAHSLGKLMADHTQVGTGQAAGPVHTIDNVCLAARSRLHSSLQCSRVWHAFVSLLYSSANVQVVQSCQDGTRNLLGSVRLVQAICQPS